MCDHWGCGYKWRQCSRSSSSKFVTMMNWACWHKGIFDWNSQEYSKLYMWFGVPGNWEIINCRVLCCTPFRVSISTSYWLGIIIIYEVVWSILANWRLVVVSLNWLINTLKMELSHDLRTLLILYMDIHRQSLSIDRHPVSSVSVNRFYKVIINHFRKRQFSVRLYLSLFYEAGQHFQALCRL